MGTTTRSADGLTLATIALSNPKPLTGSLLTGFIASLCCGGSIIFASVGLGAFYSALGMWRFVPQALTAGALSIVAINYLFYRRAMNNANGSVSTFRAKMFASTLIGLAMMAGTFIFLEWLNHGVVHADRFLARPEFSQALITGVPNVELLYVAATFFALVVLWALPFQHRISATVHDDGWMKRAVRVVVLGVTTVLMIGVVVDGSSKFGTSAGGHGAPAARHGAPAVGQHGE